MAWGSLFGGLIGAGGNSLSTMWQTIAGFKNADRQKSAIRHLRRREYQDMVFSMRRAGLNPMLATGATPGHSAVSAIPVASSDLGNALSKGMQAASTAKDVDRKVSLTPYEKAILKAEEDLRIVEKGGALVTAERTAAERDKIRADIENIPRMGALLEAQAIQQGASAKELQAREEQIRKDMSGRIGGNITQDPVGYVGGIVEKSINSSSAQELRDYMNEKNREAGIEKIYK